jgi:hypothetical protein
MRLPNAELGEDHGRHRHTHCDHQCTHGGPDMALEVGSEQALVQIVLKARRKSTTTKDNKDREQHRHKRAALMLTAMLVATTAATSDAELTNMETTRDPNQPTQAVHGCHDQRSHTTKVEWRQNGHMVMAHATAINVNQPTNVIGDGRCPTGLLARHRFSAPDICGRISVPRSALPKPAVLDCTSAPTRPGRGCQNGRSPASPGRFSDSQPDSNPFVGHLKKKWTGGLFEQPNPTVGLTHYLFLNTD